MNPRPIHWALHLAEKRPLIPLPVVWLVAEVDLVVDVARKPRSGVVYFVFAKSVTLETVVTLADL